MKTLSRLVRRYIAAALAIALLVLLVNIASFIALLARAYKLEGAQNTWLARDFAASFAEGEDGLPVPEDSESTRRLLASCAWAMLLSDEGDILWRYRLPEELERRYTLSDAASFSRWYWADYPVFTYLNAFGIVVTGMPKGSYVRVNYYVNAGVLHRLLAALPGFLLLDGALVIGFCLLLGFGASRPLREVGLGIDALSRGEPVTLPERGMTGELAAKLNRTSELLLRQREAISRRDSARTNWIAGVSHDIRTPLSLILGYAEQLERGPLLPGEQQKKAAAVRAQAQKIRSLIEDLNLTSKLQYDAQPLRRSAAAAGPLLRRIVTDFCNSPPGERMQVDFDMDGEAEQTHLFADAALLGRAVDNLLLNSARHNPRGCTLSVTVRGGETLTLTVSDDGAGYPEAVLRSLAHPGCEASAPHILGLHLVRQIACAHGGSVFFGNNEGGGALTRITLPALPPDGGAPALPHGGPRHPPHGRAQA